MRKANSAFLIYYSTLSLFFFLTPLIHSTTLQSTSPLPSLSCSIASPTTLRLFYNFIKCLSHFLVGYSEYIPKFITVLYSEIARLIKEQFGTSTCNIGSLKNTILETGKGLKKHIGATNCVLFTVACRNKSPGVDITSSPGEPPNTFFSINYIYLVIVRKF